MRAAVTGATGFVGSHLVEALLARGDEVVCLVRSVDRAAALGRRSGCRLVPGSLDEPLPLRSLVDGADVVFHVAGAVTAAASDGGRFARVNREGTARLADVASRIAEGLGFELRDAATGGASDANPVAGMGVPVLDGLGPIGGSDHSPGEWLDVDSVTPRMALLAGLIASA